MTTQWNSKVNKSLETLQSGVLDDSVVILMQGKNSFGDRIYSFLKITVKDFMRMHGAMQAGTVFNPSDYGSVLAAGRGDPPDEVRAEISSMYKILDSAKAGPAPVAAPKEQKAWDEY